MRKIELDGFSWCFWDQWGSYHLLASQDAILVSIGSLAYYYTNHSLTLEAWFVYVAHNKHIYVLHTDVWCSVLYDHWYVLCIDAHIQSCKPYHIHCLSGSQANQFITSMQEWIEKQRILLSLFKCPHCTSIQGTQARRSCSLLVLHSWAVLVCSQEEPDMVSSYHLYLHCHGNGWFILLMWQ
jgi:hypothetical protein